MKTGLYWYRVVKRVGLCRKIQSSLLEKGEYIIIVIYPMMHKVETKDLSALLAVFPTLSFAANQYHAAQSASFMYWVNY